MTIRNLISEIELAHKENDLFLLTAADALSGDLKLATNKLTHMKIKGPFTIWETPSLNKSPSECHGLLWDNYNFKIIFDETSQPEQIDLTRRDRVFLIANLLPQLLEKIKKSIDDENVFLRSIFENKST